MRPEKNSFQCENQNIFTSIYESSIAPRLPRGGSIADRIMTHTTAARPFFETVSRDLCENNRVSPESGERALSFMARSAATGITVAGTAGLVGFGLVAGSPLLAVGAGVAGLAFLPPLADSFVHGTATFLGEVTSRIGGYLRGGDE
jgi:hypothetical protein